MTVLHRRPGPALDGLVRSIGYEAGGQPRTSVEKILPVPVPSLWINLNRDEFRSYAGDGGSRIDRVPGAMLAGPRGRALVTEFEEGRVHISVSFPLGAAPGFFGVPLAVTRDQMVPLEDLWGRDGAVLRERLLEAATPHDALRVMEDVLLLRRPADPVVAGPAVVAAVRALSAGARVGAVADALGMPARTLRRRFAAQIGLTPKRFARVQRLRRVVRGLDGTADPDWAAVAAAYGYSDQSHLADDFRDLAGVTPGRYLRSRIGGPNHLRFP